MSKAPKGEKAADVWDRLVQMQADMRARGQTLIKAATEDDIAGVNANMNCLYPDFVVACTKAIDAGKFGAVSALLASCSVQFTHKLFPPCQMERLEEIAKTNDVVAAMLSLHEARMTTMAMCLTQSEEAAAKRTLGIKPKSAVVAGTKSRMCH